MVRGEAGIQGIGLRLKSGSFIENPGLEKTIDPIIKLGDDR